MSKGHGNGANYANLLFTVAKEVGKLSEILEDLQEISKINDSDINTLFALPVVNKVKKMDIIDSLKKIDFQIEVINLFKLLITYDDTDLLRIIIREYIALYQQEYNVQVVYATFARKITEETRVKLIARLEQRFNKTIVMLVSYDEKLIAGLKLQYDNYEINNTVKNQMKKLEKAL